jgi:outer membrane protein assembly factor BamD
MFRILHAKMLLVALVLFFTACGKNSYESLLKSRDLLLKEEKAKEYYAKKKYAKALPLIEDVYTYLRGTAKAEGLYYLRAKCLYKLEFYYEAAYHFDQFTKLFPNSDKEEECSFLSALCHYKNAPPVNLSQAETYEAIESLKAFSEYYPESYLMDSTNMLLDKLRYKQETKMYNWANLYYKMGQLNAAQVAFKLVLRDFPGNPYQEDIQYKIVKAAYKFAKKSVEYKKMERYQRVMEDYYAFVDNFPESKKMRELSLFYKEAQRVLEKESNYTEDQEEEQEEY